MTHSASHAPMICDWKKNKIWNTRALWKCHDAPNIVIMAGGVYRRKTWGIWGWTLATCNNSSKVGIILCAPESIPNTNALVEGRKCSKPRFLQPNWWGVLQVLASTIHIIHQVRTRSLRSPVWHVQKSIIARIPYQNWELSARKLFPCKKANLALCIMELLSHSLSHSLSLSLFLSLSHRLLDEFS